MKADAEMQENARDNLDDLLAQIRAQQAEVESLRDQEREYGHRASIARERLDRMQETFDRAVLDHKGEALKGSKWGREARGL